MKLLLVSALVILPGMVGVSLGYHRYLAHKSFEPVRWLEVLIVILGLPAGTPVQWAGNHRAHHAYADTPRDPHSPHHGGFWWAHNGWYLGTRNAWICAAYALAGPLRALFDSVWRPRTNQAYHHLAKDIQADPVLAWLSRPGPYFVFVVGHTLVALGSAFAIAGFQGVLLAFACYVYVYNVGDAVDSIGHLIGPRNVGSANRATNFWVLGLLAFGDGWHGNHHDEPLWARHGRGPHQLDLSFCMLRIFQGLGWVRSLRLKPQPPSQPQPQLMR